MDQNWIYVAWGYGITAVTLTSYGVWIWQRTKRARASMPDGDAG